jgi:hypothetical protein
MAGRGSKAPALVDDVRAMVEQLPASTAGLRDRALLLVGFAGAFRRGELIGLDTTTSNSPEAVWWPS